VTDPNFHIISLGCAKNTVDSESMAQLLQSQGLIYVEQPGDADFIIVNTCGFIGPAKDESLELLRELAASKTDG
jgi:ribosomal protein S12 methylthiotransferase